jgi:hypothetical protein
MRIKYPLLVAALATPLAAGCDGIGPDSSERTLLVQHHMAECVGEAITLCLLVREPNDPAFGYRHAPIDDFTYEWGVTYEIRVEQRSVPDPGTDASSSRTVLDSLVVEEPVAAGTEFVLYLTAGQNRVQRVADDRYRFYDEREFTCSVSVCDALAPEIAAGERIRFEFAHPAQSTEPLTLRKWEVCDRAIVGSTLCVP